MSAAPPALPDAISLPINAWLDMMRAIGYAEGTLAGLQHFSSLTDHQRAAITEALTRLQAVE